MSDARSAADLTATTAKGLRWISVSRIGTEIVLLASMVALARLVSPAAFGQFTIAVIVQELALGIPAEGVGSALVQRREVSREHLQAGLALALLTAAGLTVITLLLASFVIAPLLGATTASLVRLSTPLFFLASLSVVPIATLRRTLDFRRLSQIELASSLVRASVSLVLAGVFGLQGSSLVLGGLAAGAVATAIAWAYAPQPAPRLQRHAVRDLSGFGVPATLAAICWAGFRNGDYAVLNARLGATAAGLYWRAYTLAVDYQRKLTVVTYTVAFPMLARTENADDLAALRRRVVRLLTTVLFPLLTGLAITAPTLIPWLFGANWRPAVVPTQILCLAGAVTLVTDAAGTALMAAGRARAVLGFGIAHFAMYVGSVIVVAPFGLTAVAIDAGAVHGAYLIVAYVLLVRGSAERPLAALWRDIGAAATSSAAMAVAMVPVDWLTAQGALPVVLRLLAVGVAGTVAYVVALRAGFAESWTDLVTFARRILPNKASDRLRVLGRKRLRALVAGRAT